MEKSVPIKKGPPSRDHETVYSLQAAIDLAYGTTGHIHEGPINPATGWPVAYHICDDPSC